MNRGIAGSDLTEGQILDITEGRVVTDESIKGLVF